MHTPPAPPKLLTIVGPTASGKTELAVQLAMLMDAEVVSADSMQIYRRMDIGTAKPTQEEMRGVPHHMLDVAEPWESYSVARYVTQAAAAIEDILSRGKKVIVTGGTGLYIDSLLCGRTFAPHRPDLGLRQSLERRYRDEGGHTLLRELEHADPETARRLHPNDQKRIVRALEVYQATGKPLSQHDRETRAAPPRYSALTIGLQFENRGDMWARIDRRMDRMLAQGLEEEIRALLAEGVSPSCTAMQAIGYKEFLSALQKGEDLAPAAREVKLRSRQYAKRQLTWFRRKEQTKWIVWKEIPDFVSAVRTSTKYLEEFGLV